MQARAEPCPLEGQAEIPYSDAACQFYLGTTAYRAEAYEIAAAHWKRVVAAADDSDAGRAYESMAHSNLAFLKFQGLGVPKNKPGAIKDWRTAASLGSVEARRHLGWVYSASDYHVQDPVLALAWYKSVILAMPDTEILDDDDRAVYEDALDGIADLEADLDKEAIKEAEARAAELP